MFLGGLICENGGKLIKDIRRTRPASKIMAPDGFTPVSATSRSPVLPPRARVSVAGLPNTRPEGRRQGVRQGVHEGRQARRIRTRCTRRRQLR